MGKVTMWGMLLQVTFWLVVTGMLKHFRRKSRGFVHADYGKSGCSAGLGAAGGDGAVGRQPGLRGGSAESQRPSHRFCKELGEYEDLGGLCFSWQG